MKHLKENLNMYVSQSSPGSSKIVLNTGKNTTINYLSVADKLGKNI